MKTLYRTPAGVGCYRTRSTSDGTCPRCDRELVYRPMQGAWFCPRRTRDPLWKMRKHASGPVRFVPEGTEWLAAKLGLEPSNPDITEVALQLARNRKLLVLVTRNGSLVAVAKVAA